MDGLVSIGLRRSKDFKELILGMNHFFRVMPKEIKLFN